MTAATRRSWRRWVALGCGAAIGTAAAFWLRPMLAAGSASVPHRFSTGQVAYANQVNANFDALVAAIQELSGKVDQLAPKVTSLETRVEKTEKGLQSVADDVAALEPVATGLQGLEDDVRVLEASLAAAEQRLQTLEDRGPAGARMALWASKLVAKYEAPCSSEPMALKQGIGVFERLGGSVLGGGSLSAGVIAFETDRESDLLLDLEHSRPANTHYAGVCLVLDGSDLTCFEPPGVETETRRLVVPQVRAGPHTLTVRGAFHCETGTGIQGAGVQIRYLGIEYLE